MSVGKNRFTREEIGGTELTQAVAKAILSADPAIGDVAVLANNSTRDSLQRRGLALPLKGRYGCMQLTEKGRRVREKLTTFAP